VHSACAAYYSGQTSVTRPVVNVTRPVVIDITRLLGRYIEKRHPTGVDRVTLAYAQHYADNCRVMLRWRGRSGLFSAAISRRVIDILLRWDADQLNQLRMLIVRGVMSSIGTGDAKGAVLLHTGHNDAELASLWRNIRWHNLRPVFFVHDLIPLTHPQFCREGEPQVHRQRVLSMLQGAALVANSHHTLAELTDFARQHSIKMPPQCVALLAPAQQFVSELARPIGLSTADSLNKFKKPYFLMLGTIEPRKNHALVLQVWQKMLNTMPLEDVPGLVVIGQTGWDCEDIEAQLRDGAQFKGRVSWIPQCDDAELAHWMQDACALLFPSYVEGFGMPAVEALLANTPVIANDLAVFRESVKDIPEYILVDKLQSWTEQIVLYSAPGSASREAQLLRMQSWQAPTWTAHFERVDALLASLPNIK
jgi:glycosyltransferase involved in cell wall biosynthesis